MAKQKQIYKCNVCGNIIEVLHGGEGDFVCCGQPMELLSEKTQDAGYEKHVPLIEKTENGFKVKLGSVAHPMEESHFIEWIELTADGRSFREFLKPGQKPEAFFCVNAENVQARGYCNIHLLWKSNN